MLIGSAYGTRTNTRFTFNGAVNLKAGKNSLSLLSIAMGLPVSSNLLVIGFMTRIVIKKKNI